MGRCFLKTRRRPHGLNWECLAESYFGYRGRETDSSGWVGVTVKGSPLASPLNSELLGHRCPAGRTPELGAGSMVLHQEPEGACPFLPLPPLHPPLSEYPWRWQWQRCSQPWGGEGAWGGEHMGGLMCLQLGVRWACEQEGSRLQFSGLLFLTQYHFSYGKSEPT